MRRAAGMLALLACLAGCRVLPPPASDPAQVGVRNLADLGISIEYPRADEAVVPLVERGIRDGVAAARTWGTLRSPVRVVIYPDREAMRAAVGREELFWLEAWATEKDIALVSPGPLPKAQQDRFVQTLVHEMAHVVHYQTARIPASLTSFNDPIWFREGLASCTARQGRIRYDAQRLNALLKQHPRFDPLDPSKGDLRDRQPLVYACAHHLVDFLIRTAGIEKVREFLAVMGRGNLFALAFRTTFGFTPQQLRDRWRASIRRS